MKDHNMNVDRSNLRRVILSGADQFAQGFSAAKNIVITEKFSRVVISGIGGSALHADILRMYCDGYCTMNKDVQRLNIIQNRTYQLPPEAYEDALNIICSHSGNTEEPIASFEEVLQHNLPCIGISSGGRVEAMCKENNVPHIKLPIPFANFQPRMATGHFVSAILQVLINAGKFPDVTGYICDTIAPQIQGDIQQSEEQGKKIAATLVGKTPIIYAADHLRALAMVWKIKINENSKVPAFWNYFPEMNHNEFVGFTNPQGQFSLIMLRDRDDHPRTQLRYDITLRELRKKGTEGDIIDIVDGDIFRKLFSTIALGDWASYYLAIEYGQDPTPVDMVEDLKKALG